MNPDGWCWSAWVVTSTCICHSLYHPESQSACISSYQCLNVHIQWETRVDDVKHQHPVLITKLRTTQQNAGSTTSESSSTLEKITKVHGPEETRQNLWTISECCSTVVACTTAMYCVGRYSLEIYRGWSIWIVYSCYQLPTHQSGVGTGLRRL